MKKRKYLIVYFYSTFDMKAGNGNMFVTAPLKLTEQICIDIRDCVKQTNGFSDVGITNIIPLELVKYEVDDDTP